MSRDLELGQRFPRPPHPSPRPVMPVMVLPPGTQASHEVLTSVPQHLGKVDALGNPLRRCEQFVGVGVLESLLYKYVK